MFCVNCGKGVTEEMNFCPKCGHALHEAQTPAPNQSAAPVGSEPRGDAQEATALQKFLKTTQPGKGTVPAPPRADPSKQEFDDDEILWEGTFSGKAMLGHWLASVGLSLAVLIAASMIGPFAHKTLVVIGTLGLIWLLPLLRWMYLKLSIRYVLTARRFFHHNGILLRTTNRIELIDVDDVKVKRSLLGQLVNVGSIEMISSDKSHPAVELIGVDDPLEVAERIDHSCHRERSRRSVFVEKV